MISRILTIIPVRENSEVVTSYPDLCIYICEYKAQSTTKSKTWLLVSSKMIPKNVPLQNQKPAWR